MDRKETLKQMIQYNKTVFENTFNSLTMLQDQMEQSMELFMKQYAALPAEGKKVVEEYCRAYKKARENFKNAVDESFKKVEEFSRSTDSAA